MAQSKALPQGARAISRPCGTHPRVTIHGTVAASGLAIRQ